MPCRFFPGGVVCTGRERRKRCATPGCSDWSVALCDWKLHQVVDGKRVYTGKTCDKAMCAKHRHPVGENKDLCTPHFDLARKQGLVQEHAGAALH